MRHGETLAMDDRRAAAVLICLFLVCAAAFSFLALGVDSRQRVIHGNDGAGYYVYARSLVVDRDLDFANDFGDFFPGEVPRAGRRTGTGHTPNEYGIGFSIFALPFFLPAHGIMRAAAALGLSVRADGGSALEKLSACLASELWGALGLWLTYRALRTRFSAGTSLASVLLIWTSTSVLYYFVREPFLSHLDALFCVGLLLFLLARAEADRRAAPPLAVGAVCGALALIHPSNGVILILPIASTWLSGRRVGARSRGAWLLFLLCGAALAFTPQIVVWKIITGQYLPDPYSDGSFAFLARPRILEVLFSSNHGLLSWTPITVLALAGLAIFARERRALGVACFAALAALLYTYASWWQWWLGNSFGQRGFVSAAPIFALGLAAFLDWARSRKNLFRVWPVLLVFPVWNGVLLLSYLAELVPYAGTFSWLGLLRSLPTLPAQILRKAAGG